MSRLWKHFQNWSEAYLILPLTVASIIGASLFVQFLTGRPPAENVDWLADYSSVSMKCALVIVFTSAMKQATGSWMTKDEKLAHPYLATISDAKIIITFLAFVYMFSH